MTITQLQDSSKGRPLMLHQAGESPLPVFYRSHRISGYGNVLVAVVDEAGNSYAVEQDELDTVREVR